MLDYKIIQLDKDISNKIAAGEVVERPLAVVKELVENAIDANASKITVEIKDAGKTLIRVTDNGYGIQPDDIVLAFERHSTSKIRTINDIYNISSLGFRGEALASISSVSNMEVITKHTNYELGKKFVLTGGKVLENIDVGAPSGTTMMVKDLFFNTPARLKFLKSNNAEQNAINDIMTKLALSHPEVAFKYIVNRQNVFITPGNNKLYDVILNIYQKSLAKHLISVDFEENGIKLTGFVSAIEMTRGNRQYQIAFVNNRYVKSKTIDDAIATVYRTLIPHNRFPIVFLNVTIDPSLIDINIHPAKTEIRFHQEGLIKDLIYKAVKFEINKYNLVPSKPLNSKQLPNKEALKSYYDVNQTKDEVKEIKQDPIITTQVVKDKVSEVTDKKTFNYRQTYPDKPSKQETSNLLNSYKSLIKDKEPKEVNESVSKPLLRTPLTKVAEVVEEIYEAPKQLFDDQQETIYDHLNYIGQMFQTYLIYEKNSQMYLIDQHAAHEKILYEKFLDDYKNKKMMSQMILEPIVVNVNKMTLDNAIENSELFLNLGFSIEAFGDDALLIREIPLGFNIKTSKLIFENLIEELDFKLPKERFELALDELASRSCKAAIKANDMLMDIEVSGLVNQLKGLNEPYTCPHGRPIIIKISKSEIEKKFNRT